MLETSQYEPGNLYGKRFVAVTEAATYAGNVETLKAATGGDYLRYELKHENGTRPFINQAGIMIAANKDIQYNDHTNGIQRRRITLRLNRPIEAENQIDLEPMFLANAAGVVNWMLAMPDDEMVAYLKTPAKMSEAIAEARLEQLQNTHPLAKWFFECCEYKPGVRSYIGTKPKFGPTREEILSLEFKKLYEKLYPNYRRWFDDYGGEKPIGLNNFSEMLETFLKEILRYPNIIRGRDDIGKFIEGIATRPIM